MTQAQADRPLAAPISILHHHALAPRRDAVHRPRLISACTGENFRHLTPCRVTHGYESSDVVDAAILRDVKHHDGEAVICPLRSRARTLGRLTGNETSVDDFQPLRFRIIQTASRGGGCRGKIKKGGARHAVSQRLAVFDGHAGVEKRRPTRQEQPVFA